MAKIEREREDLIRDATAYVARCELRAPNEREPVFVGFRSNGCVSFYFGEEAVYQFNASGALRRAHCGDALWKAEDGKLVAMTRERTAGETRLVRREPPADEVEHFLQTMAMRLTKLRGALEDGTAELIRSVPEGIDVARRASEWLAGRETWPIARSAHAR